METKTETLYFFPTVEEKPVFFFTTQEGAEKALTEYLGFNPKEVMPWLACVEEKRSYHCPFCHMSNRSEFTCQSHIMVCKKNPNRGKDIEKYMSEEEFFEKASTLLHYRLEIRKEVIGFLTKSEREAFLYKIYLTKEEIEEAVEKVEKILAERLHVYKIWRSENHGANVLVYERYETFSADERIALSFLARRLDFMFYLGRKK